MRSKTDESEKKSARGKDFPCLSLFAPPDEVQARIIKRRIIAHSKYLDAQEALKRCSASLRPRRTGSQSEKPKIVGTYKSTAKSPGEAIAEWYRIRGKG